MNTLGTTVNNNNLVKVRGDSHLTDEAGQSAPNGAACHCGGPARQRPPPPSRSRSRSATSGHPDIWHRRPAMRRTTVSDLSVDVNRSCPAHCDIVLPRAGTYFRAVLGYVQSRKPRAPTTSSTTIVEAETNARRGLPLLDKASTVTLHAYVLFTQEYTARANS